MYPARRGRNVKSLRNKRFHSPYPGRITATRREGRGEVGEKDEIYSLAAVKQRRAWRLRDTLPRIVLSPGKGGVSRRISEASDIRVTIRIAGEFGVDRDKACKRIQVSSRVCVCFTPPISPCRSIAHARPPTGASGFLLSSFRNGQFAQPSYAQADPTYADTRVLYMRETNTWSGVEWKQIGCASTIRQTPRKHNSGRFGIEGSTRLVLDATVD